MSAYARSFEQNARLIEHHRLSHRVGLLLLLVAALASAALGFDAVW